VTAPATEVAGIYGPLTNAMPPQGDYFMTSTLAVPDFTWQTSCHNQLPGVLRSSLADLPEFILLLVAKARQRCIDIMIYKRNQRREYNRYGLYPAFE
jgi:hypothetical protein